jgi:hypothetical protein
MSRFTCFIHTVVFTTMFMNTMKKGTSLRMYHHEADVERHFGQSLRTEFTRLRTDSPTIQKSPILQTLK